VFTLREILFMTLAPTALCFVGLALGARLRTARHETDEGPLRSFAAAAFGAAYLLSHYGHSGWPWAATLSGWQWLWYGGLAATLWELAPLPDEPPMLASAIRWPGRLIILGFLAALVIRPVVAGEEGSTAALLVWVAGILLFGATVQSGLAILARHAAARDATLMPLAIALAGSVSLGLTFSGRLAVLCGIVAAATGGAVLFALWQPSQMRSALPAITPIFGLLLIGLWLNGQFLSELPRSATLLLGLAAWPMALAWRKARRDVAPEPWELAKGVEPPPVRRGGLIWCGCAASLAMLLAAVWQAYQISASREGGYY